MVNDGNAVCEFNLYVSIAECKSWSFVGLN